MLSRSQISQHAVPDSQTSPVDVPYDLEEALVSVRGNCRYQRKLLLGVGVVYTAASTFIVGLGFFLAPPKFICENGRHCSEQEACRQGHYRLDPSSVHSMVYEWKLVCDEEFQASLIGSLYFVGLTVGSMLIGTLTDRLGRQRTCLVCLLVQGATLLLGAFAPSPLYIDIVSAVAGAGEAVLSVAVYMLLVELLSTDLRSWFSGLALVFWSMGTILVALLFLAFDNWRYAMVVCGAIPFAMLPVVFCLPESIRWLVANKHRLGAAMRILQSMAKTNGIDPSTVRLKPLVEDSMRESATSTLLSGFRGLLFSRKMRLRLFGINFIWITVNICYYGILMCVSSYQGNVYVNGVLLGLGEAIPNIVMGRLAGRLKRKTILVVSCALGCVLCIVVWSLGETSCETSCKLMSMALLLAAMMAIDTFFLVIYIYTSELFPTKVRGAGYTVCSTLSRVGGLVASNLLFIQQRADIHPLLIIACSLLASVPAVLTLPETLGQSLLDYS